MSGFQPFQLEPTYSPGEEPSEEDFEDVEEEEREGIAKVGNTDWCVCVSMPTEDECCCCQELEEFNHKFDE